MSSQIKDRSDLRLLAREGASSAPPPHAVPLPTFPWKTRVALPAALLGLVVLLLGYTARSALWPATEVRVVPVVVKSTTQSAGASIVQAPGWVEADPYPISVSALTDGVVKDVLVLEGQQVKAGDVVVRLVDDDAKLELARAEAEVADRIAALEAAQKQWDNPIERVRAVATAEAQVAELLAALEKNTAEIAAEEARMKERAVSARRLRQAFESNAATHTELEEAELRLQAQEAMHKFARAQHPVLEAQLKQKQAELEAARRNLELRIEEIQALASGKAAVALGMARRDEAKLRLDRTQVRSPADGIVMSRFAEPGAKLVIGMDDPHSAHAIRLYDPRRLQVRVDVPLADAAKVGVGQEAKIVVGVLPDKTFDGKVTRIVNEADIQKNTLQVKVSITNPSSELKPEMLARVRFMSAPEHADHTSNLVFAPERLIHRTNGGAKVWVVDTKRNVAAHRDIKLGDARQDGWIAVASGLFPGDLLIDDPSRVSEGTKVRIVADAAAKGGEHASH